jgi:hypothetical protein
MPKIDPQALAIVNELMKGAQQIAKDEELQPFAFVHANGEIHTVAMTFKDQDSKERAASRVRRAVVDLDADWVFVVLESYMAKFDKDDTEFEKVKNGEMRVSAHPKRIEAAVFLLETKEGSYMGHGEITGPMGNRTFPIPDLEEGGKAEGIFSNLLPDKKVA